MTADADVVRITTTDQMAVVTVTLPRADFETRAGHRRLVVRGASVGLLQQALGPRVTLRTFVIQATDATFFDCYVTTGKSKDDLVVLYQRRAAAP